MLSGQIIIYHSLLPLRISLGLGLIRRFINARVKWVRDPYLDDVVEREKNLLPCLSLKKLVLSSSSSSLPISTSATTPPLSFFLRYPTLFQLSPTASHVSLTPQFLTLHWEEQDIHNSSPHLCSAALRLAKLLMLTKAAKIPIAILDDLRFDLGLPYNYVPHFLSHFPDYFRISYDLGLELVSWRQELALPSIANHNRNHVHIRFPISFPPGFDLKKKVGDWVEQWQCLPYISPYEDAFHLAPNGDQADKWTVAVLHEILSLLVSKKTEVKNVLSLGDYLGFGIRFKKILTRHPGIFYVSNKLRTQTVVLREAFKKNFLIENHPLMGMRHRYIYLMNKSKKRKKFVKYSTRCNLQAGRMVMVAKQ